MVENNDRGIIFECLGRFEYSRICYDCAIKNTCRKKSKIKKDNEAFDNNKDLSMDWLRL